MSVPSETIPRNHFLSKRLPRKTKGVRSRKDNVELTVSREINLGEIPDYLKHTLVGCFCSKSPRREALRNWVQENWEGELGYNPEFHILPRGWFLMKLHDE